MKKINNNIGHAPVLTSYVSAKGVVVLDYLMSIDVLRFLMEL